MAEEDEIDEEDGPEGEEGEEESGGSKKKVIIIVGAVLLLLVGGMAAAYFTGLLDPLFGSSETEGEEGAEEDFVDGPPVYFDLQELLVNLNSDSRKSVFLKIRVSLELSEDADKEKLELVMPRIIDGFQTYLRELRVSDLKGSAGLYRLREELLQRVNATSNPVKVRDVLFKEILIQ